MSIDTCYCNACRVAREKDAEIEQICAALEAVVSDIEDYERVNNLAPNPGRKYCWDSVAQAHAILAKFEKDPS